MKKHEWYRKQVKETLDLIAEKGCIMEVNSRGLYKHDPPLVIPWLPGLLNRPSCAKYR